MYQSDRQTLSVIQSTLRVSEWKNLEILQKRTRSGCLMTPIVS